MMEIINAKVKQYILNALVCHYTCLTCKGATKNECLKCSSENHQ
jgi:hypothetical protein